MPETEGVLPPDESDEMWSRLRAAQAPMRPCCRIFRVNLSRGMNTVWMYDYLGFPLSFALTYCPACGTRLRQ